MKFNLRKRPLKPTNPDNVIFPNKWYEWIEKEDQWFEGFEKELREKLDLYTRLFDSKAITSMETFVQFIKEILGEN